MTSCRNITQKEGQDRGNHPQMISDGLIYLILSELLEFLLKCADQPLRSGKREKIWI